MYDKDVLMAEFNNREDYIAVGKEGIVSIKYHPCMAEGDRHYIDVKYENGNNKRIFDICELKFCTGQ